MEINSNWFSRYVISIIARSLSPLLKDNQGWIRVRHGNPRMEMKPAIIVPKKNPLISLGFSWWFLRWHWRVGPLDSHDIWEFPSFMCWKCGITPAFQRFSFEIWIKKYLRNRSNLFNLRVKIPSCAAFFATKGILSPQKGLVRARILKESVFYWYNGLKQ